MKSNYFLMPLLLFPLFNAFSQDISTNAEVYDFDVGDVFHLEYTYKAGGYVEEHSIYLVEIIDKYYLFGNTVLNYDRAITRMDFYGASDTTYYSYTDAKTIENLDDPVNNGEITSVYNDPPDYNGRLINEFYEVTNNLPSYYQVLTKKFTEGCGLAYNSNLQTIMNSVFIETMELIYFKKGSEEWGNPVLTSLPADHHDETIVNCFPNPAHQYFILEAENIKINSVYILSMTGETIKSVDVTASQQRIDIAGLKAGFYLLLIETGEKVIRKSLVVNN